MTLDHARFAQALARELRRPYAGVLAPEYGGEAPFLPRLRARLASLPARFELEQLLPDPDPDQPDFADWTGQALLLARCAVAAGPPGPPTLVEGDYVLDFNGYLPVVVPGDLTVTGSLRTQGTLLVLGQLHVHGSWHDADSQTVVAGDLLVGHTLHSAGWLGVGGALRAPYVRLGPGPGGAALVLGGVRTRLLWEQAHGGSHVFGPVRAEYLRTDALCFGSTARARPAHPWPAPPAWPAELLQPAFATAWQARLALAPALPEADRLALAAELDAAVDQAFAGLDPAVLAPAQIAL